MDLITAIESTGPAKDALMYNQAASIEEGGEFPPMPTIPFGGMADRDFSPSQVSSPQHAKLVVALVCGIFTATAAMASYLILN